MGGAAKPLLVIDGVSLLERALRAVAAVGAAPVVVVAERDADLAARHPEVSWTREDPPFGGPAAAVVAAVRSWQAPAADDPDWTFVLACDLPLVGPAVVQLMDAIMLLPSDTEGVCLADPGSRPQWLTGLYRTAAVRDAALRLPREGRDAPARELVADLAIAVVAASADVVADVDTWEDLERARRRAEGGGR